MTTDDPNTKPDPADLLAALEFTKLEHRSLSTGGAWVQGTIAGHRFDALIFPEHAECESYEMGDSRISKLWLQRIDDRMTAAHFERGWEVHPTTDEAKAIVDLLAAGLAERIYGK